MYNVVKTSCTDVHIITFIHRYMNIDIIYLEVTYWAILLRKIKFITK